MTARRPGMSSMQVVRVDATSIETRLETVSELVEIADREGPEQVSAKLAFEYRVAFGELVRSFDAELRRRPEAYRPSVVARVREVVMPLVRRSENARRWLARPAGRPGDGETIARMYDNEPRGATAVERLIDRSFLDVPAVIAIQNRRAVLRDKIARTARASGDTGPARVTSLGCGPARELVDFYDHVDDPRSVIATLIDTDPIAHEARDAARRSAGELSEVAFVEADPRHVATLRPALAPQDLVYCVGVADYLDDDRVIAILDWIHDTLRPGGQVVLGNFHPSSSTRALMEHVLDWHLYYRDEADMQRLAQASKFARPWARLRFETQKINLFAELTR